MNIGTKNVVIWILAVLLTLSFSMQANAATPEQIEASIDNGLAWLANHQQADGNWTGGYYNIDNDIGATGLALLKFIEYAKEQGMNPTDPAYKYSSNVTKGLKYLDSHLNNVSVGAGQYDGNSNGNMIYLGTGDRTYYTGIATMAYAANPGTPKDLVQDLTDWLVNAQCTDNTAQQYGVWSYSGFSCWGDNSNTGYATLGLGYALKSGATVPPGTNNTKTNLSSYVNYIQNKPGAADDGTEDDPDGGSGYTSPDSWVNSLKTGNLIFEAVLSGDAIESPRILNATDYIDRHWNDNVEGWKGNLSAQIPYNTQYQTTYTIMKGFEAIGLVTLNGKNWFDNISTVIVNDQLPDGNWTKCPNYVWQGGWGASIATDDLCTAWALLTLEKVTPIKPPTGGNVTGGGSIVSPITPPPKKGNAAPNNKATFGFVAHYADGATIPSGNLQYTDHVSGMNVHGNVTALSVDKATMTAIFSGTAKVNGVDGYAYTVTVVDNGEPGKSDTFAINIPGVPYTASGTLTGGNIKIHNP